MLYDTCINICIFNNNLSLVVLLETIVNKMFTNNSNTRLKSNTKTFCILYFFFSIFFTEGNNMY